MLSTHAADKFPAFAETASKPAPDEFAIYRGCPSPDAADRKWKGFSSFDAYFLLPALTVSLADRDRINQILSRSNRIPLAERPPDAYPQADYKIVCSLSQRVYNIHISKKDRSIRQFNLDGKTIVFFSLSDEDFDRLIALLDSSR